MIIRHSSHIARQVRDAIFHQSFRSRLGQTRLKPVSLGTPIFAVPPSLLVVDVSPVLVEPGGTPGGHSVVVAMALGSRLALVDEGKDAFSPLGRGAIFWRWKKNEGKSCSRSLECGGYETRDQFLCLCNFLSFPKSGETSLHARRNGRR